MSSRPTEEEMWRHMLTEGEESQRRFNHLASLLPSNPRCKACNAPFKGPGGLVMRMIGKRQSKINPRFCNPCAPIFAHPGGAEVELTMLFADVRNSTTLAEGMSASDFSRLMQRFYNVATDTLIQTDAMVDKFVGDQVIAFYLPGFAGKQHARLAVDAAQRLLQATGHDNANGPWLPLGVGIHTGVAFVGVVIGKESGEGDVTALGDNVNIAARLAALAGTGEVVLSNETYAAAGLELSGLEQRQVNLKGKSAPFDVRIWRPATS